MITFFFLVALDRIKTPTVITIIKNPIRYPIFIILISYCTFVRYAVQIYCFFHINNNKDRGFLHY